MEYSWGEGSATVLLLACPKVDLEGAAAVCQQRGAVVLPAGGAGDLSRAALTAAVLIVDIDLDEELPSRPVARWHARLGEALPLGTQQFYSLLPPTWVARHPGAFEGARSPSRPKAIADDIDPWERQWELDGEPVDDDGEPAKSQVFIPVTELSLLTRTEWVFTNELVPKQARRGRRYLPRVPTLVQLPD